MLGGSFFAGVTDSLPSPPGFSIDTASADFTPSELKRKCNLVPPHCKPPAGMEAVCGDWRTKQDSAVVLNTAPLFGGTPVMPQLTTCVPSNPKEAIISGNRNLADEANPFRPGFSKLAEEINPSCGYAANFPNGDSAVGP